MTMKTIACRLLVATALALPTCALAQVPVIDSANLSAAQSTATNTADIMASNQAIKSLSNQILQSVTGNRTSDAQGGGLMGAGLGGGNSVAQAPSWGQLMSGGPMAWGSLSGNSTDLASKLINGLQLVKSITGLTGGERHAADAAYQNSVNVAATLSGLIDSTQGSIQSRSTAFTQGGQMIGKAADLKGSVDQNTQIQIQTGQTINEMTGVVNNAAAAANQQNLDRIAAASAASRAMTFTQK